MDARSRNRRISRDYRTLRGPTKFLTFCKRVQHGLTDNPNLPETVETLRKEYCEKVGQLDKVHHVSLDGSKAAIRQREALREEIILLLDQLAAFLESAFVLDPEALLTTGFTVTQERRNTTRVKLPLTAPMDFSVINVGDPGKALGSASRTPGALIREIQINRRDPSLESEWFHKNIFAESQEMLMENLLAGNTFFRMRPFGPDGAGPWSAVVTVTIT